MFVMYKKNREEMFLLWSLVGGYVVVILEMWLKEL